MQALTGRGRPVDKEKNALFAILIGMIHAALPERAWYLANGWKFKDAKPSEAAITWYRTGGVLVAIGALLYLIL